MIKILRLERVRRRLTQSGLSSLTGGSVSQAKISLLERGFSPTEEEMRVLGEALNIPGETLFEEAR